uniref:Transmembrane protein n=1 Tax=Rhizophora mucronata TaxID=61149 RepID=A0A2P2NS42_RHIMU
MDYGWVKVRYAFLQLFGHGIRFMMGFNLVLFVPADLVLCWILRLDWTNDDSL